MGRYPYARPPGNAHACWRRRTCKSIRINSDQIALMSPWNTANIRYLLSVDVLCQTAGERARVLAPSRLYVYLDKFGLNFLDVSIECRQYWIFIIGSFPFANPQIGQPTTVGPDGLLIIR